MSGKYCESLSDSALEHIMRDVLSGLEDFSNGVELECQTGTMEIIFIKTTRGADTPGQGYAAPPAPRRHTARTRHLRLLQ